VIAALGDKYWIPLCDALALAGLAARPELATNAGRATARVAIDAAVAHQVARMTTEEVLDRLRRAGIPHAPVNGVIAALTAPYVTERGCVQAVRAPEGTYHVATSPLRAPGVELGPAPAVGEHNREVLGALSDRARRA
jgi:crotonobetainyl-CoA:carnitine CoA-transferase CaiB-like acyl-CoA transferase